MQLMIIILLFAGALFYLGRMMYQQFNAKNHCGGGCNGCNAIDFNAIEKKISAENKSFQQ